ncbi:MAG: hypothetical protein L6R37_005631 [Teloschistes peruensis]|nr:MAG: hypothetical protein L6R37_005631 [Teloschistes peruensis]
MIWLSLVLQTTINALTQLSRKVDQQLRNLPTDCQSWEDTFDTLPKFREGTGIEVDLIGDTRLTNTFERPTWNNAEPGILMALIELKFKLLDTVWVLKQESKQMDQVIKDMFDVFHNTLRLNTDAKGDLSRFREWEVTDYLIEPMEPRADH